MYCVVTSIKDPFDTKDMRTTANDDVAFAMAIQKCVEMNIVLREQLAASLRDSGETAETEPVLTRAG